MHNITPVRIEDIDFPIDSLSLLAIECIRLLESRSTKISNIDLNSNGYRSALVYRSYRYEISSSLKLTINLIDLKLVTV